MTWVAIILLPVLCQETSVSGTTRPSMPPDPAEVRRLVAELDHDDFAVREAATRALIALGGGAREIVAAARNDGSPEARMRIDRVLEVWDEAERGSGTVPFAATRVAFPAGPIPLRDAVLTLARAGGTSIRIPPGLDSGIPVTLDGGEMPFFRALDAICSAASWQHHRDGQNRGWQVAMDSEPPNPHVAYEGPLRIELQHISVTRQLRLGGSPHVSAFLQLRIDSEDSFPMLGVRSSARVDAVVDDQGRSLADDGATPPPEHVSRTGPRRQAHLSVRIAPPGREARSIRTLDLTVSILHGADYGVLLLEEPFGPTPPSAAQGDISAAVRGAARAGSRIELELALHRPPSPGPSIAGPPVTDQIFELGDGSGAFTEARSAGPLPGGDGEELWKVVFDDGPARLLRVRILTSYAMKDVPVAFRDIPLP